jgi:uncharacterized protein with HEPN domain
MKDEALAPLHDILTAGNAIRRFVYRNVFSFRNILIHGYDTIDDHIVWSVTQDGLPRLLDDVQQLLL